MTYEEECTQFLANNRTAALLAYSALTGRPASWQSFNGTFGGKNSTHLSKPLNQFTHFEEYICDWLDHVISDYQRRVNGGTLIGSSAERMVNCLKNANLRNYIMTFLARTFCKETGIAASNHGCPPYSHPLSDRFVFVDQL